MARPEHLCQLTSHMVMTGNSEGAAVSHCGRGEWGWDLKQLLQVCLGMSLGSGLFAAEGCWVLE